MAKATGITKTTRKISTRGKHITQRLQPSRSSIQPLPPRVVDYTGRRCGKLTIVGFVAIKSKCSQWLCLCDCGASSIVAAPNLRSGKTRSCGSRACRLDTRTMSDGYSVDPVYTALNNAKARCTNPRDPHYDRYGQRGIEYRLGPLSEAAARVLEHLGPRPDGWVLDRIDNDGHYELANLRWIDPRGSARNREVTPYVEVFGERWALIDVARVFGVPYQRLHQRIARGWHPQVALSSPPTPLSERRRKAA